MAYDDATHALERTTLGLINMVAFSATSREHARRFADATGLELPTSDIRVLEHLAGREPVATSSLARALAIDITQASRQVGQLAAAGHVERSTDPADRRRTLVALAHVTGPLLDDWLLSWAAGYDTPAQGWRPAEVDDLAAWFGHVHDCLAQALPDRPAPTAAQRWLALTHGNGLSRAHIRLVMTVVDLVAWVAQSGGFNDLLAEQRAPIRQLAFFTLRMVSRHGPLSVADVAERMGVDHTQASKRITQLVDARLVERTAHARDRRTTVVSATRRGVSLERRIRSVQLQGFTDLLGAIPPARRDRWTVLAQRYTDALMAVDGSSTAIST